jgi:hypothetical protein
MLKEQSLWTLWTAVHKSDWRDRQADPRTLSIRQSPQGSTEQFAAAEGGFGTDQ